MIANNVFAGTDFELYELFPAYGFSFSFVGFEKQEIQVGGQNNISIIMKPSAAELDELVVTALGIKRQKRT